MELAAAVAPSIIGGLLGSDGKQQSQTTQQTLDPRMEPYIYGAGGVLPSAQNWFKANPTGMNAQMATGLDNQWNQLGASTQGYNQMQNVGMGLLGGGVAGNPFTGGGYVAPQSLSYNPAQFTGGQSNGQFQQANTQGLLSYQLQQAKDAEAARLAAEQAARLAALQQAQSAWSGGGGGNFDGTNGYSYSGGMLGNSFGGSGYGGPGTGNGNDGGSAGRGTGNNRD